MYFDYLGAYIHIMCCQTTKPKHTIYGYRVAGNLTTQNDKQTLYAYKKDTEVRLCMN